MAGSKNPRDFVTIVEKGSREGAYGGYEYVTKPGAFKLVAPPKPGEYEIRLLAADSPYPTLARRPLRIDAVEATLDAPAQVAAGAKFTREVDGPEQRARLHCDRQRLASVHRLRVHEGGQSPAN